MVRIMLKKGVGVQANAVIDLIPGRKYDIAPHFVNKETMVILKQENVVARTTHRKVKKVLARDKKESFDKTSKNLDFNNDGIVDLKDAIDFGKEVVKKTIGIRKK